MRWWCSAIKQDWDWTPRPFIGVWILVAAIAGSYARMWHNHRRDHEKLDGDKSYMRRFAFGVVLLWVASDWPIGTLGGGYLASVHMVQYMLYTFAAAPMLILGTPSWMAEAVLGRLRLRKAWIVLSKPLVALLVTNVVLLVTHTPIGVDQLRATQYGSFAMDMVWLLAGLVMWAPVINPVPEARMKSDPGRIVYLFFAVAVVPMIPGGFITFSTNVLYSTYELAPRVGLTPLHDQQLAGVVMKLSSLPVVWIAMGVIWFRWYNRENSRPAHRRAPVRREDINLDAPTPTPQPAPISTPQPAPTAAGRAIAEHAPN